MAAALPATAQAIGQAARRRWPALPGQVSQDGTFGIVTVIPKSGPSDEATQDLVHSLRDGAPGARRDRSAPRWRSPG